MVRKVGTSRIVREIGRGGMGVVYEARQDALDRSVAIKALDASGPGAKDAIERFRREGRAHARLRHEAIVAVHDLVEKDEQLFLVMDYVDGVDLARVLKAAGAIPTDCAAVVGARVAEALDHVHFSGLVHRDVKPGNVMISRDGEVKLVDFGISRSDAEEGLTSSGMYVGSPSYLPPEVIDGAEATPASDVWALGVTLYELVTGNKPFRASSTEALLAAITRGRFTRVRRLAPSCPRRLARAIERCLARRPERRPSPRALAVALDAIAGRLLRRIHPRKRLVALLTNRGFVEEADALQWIELSTIHLTSALDLAQPEKPRSSRSLRVAVAAAILLAAGAAAWLLPVF